MSNLRQLLIALVMIGAGAAGFVYVKNAPQKDEPQSDGAAQAPARDAQALLPPTPTPQKTSTYVEALAHVDREIAFHLDRAEKQPTSWLDLENAAQRLMARAKLTGDYEDYGRAEAALAKAFQRYGDKKGGPLLSRARLHYTLHRFSEAQADVDKQKDVVMLTDVQKVGIELLNADIALNLGRYDEAVAVWEKRLEKRKEFGSLLRLASYREQTGQIETARRLYAEAQDMVADGDPQTIAFLELQRGHLELQVGRYDEALEHYHAGEAALSGWWLLEEHVAEIWTLTGKTDQALARYLVIAQATNNPEMIASVAAIYAEKGDITKAKEWNEKARVTFDALIEKYPAAAAGHALEFYLENGPAERAVVLAKQNDAQRPNAEAKIGLAKALLLAGDNAGAKLAIDAALATPWRTADLFDTAAEAYSVLGDDAKAAEFTTQARALKPTRASGHSHSH